jgi:hypothetical protein
MVQAQFRDGESCFMKRLADTDVWYATFKINRRVRAYYTRIPAFPPHPSSTICREQCRRPYREHTLTSALLKNTGDVRVYTPPGYSKTATPYSTVAGFRWRTYIKVVPTPVTLDDLIAEKRIPPLVAVMIGNAPRARSSELPCNPAFADSLSAELVSLVRRLCNVTLCGAGRNLRRLSPSGSFRQCSIAIGLILGGLRRRIPPSRPVSIPIRSRAMSPASS